MTSTFFASNIYNQLTTYAPDYVLLSSLWYFSNNILVLLVSCSSYRGVFASRVPTHVHMVRENGIDTDWKKTALFSTKEGSLTVKHSYKTPITVGCRILHSLLFHCSSGGRL